MAVERLLTAKDIQRIFSCGKNRAYELIHAHGFPAIQICGRYYVKENSGVAGTRNLGVAKAKGDYIIFVDSDDFISKTLLKDIKPYIKKDIDLIKWNCTIVDEEHNLIDKPNSAQFGSVTGEEGFNLLFGKDNFIDCLWNYAIKKSIIEKFPTRNVS